MLDPIKVDCAEHEITRFVESRSNSRDKANELEAIYAESVRCHREKLRQENRWAWIRFYECLAHNHAQLADENRAKAEALLAEPGAADASG